MNEATTLTTTTSVVTEQDKGRCAPAPGSALSPFAEKMLAALQRLTKQCEPHPCGGFTTDDMQWRMGTAFTPDETLWATLDELTAARLISCCGNDDDDAIGTCYELLSNMNLSCNPAEAESVTAYVPDQPKQFSPGGRSSASAVAAVNPGRELEVAGWRARPRTLNETVFINRAAVRDFLLEQAVGTRAHRFERVSKETLVQINENVRQYMIAVVRRLPSKGKTI